MVFQRSRRSLSTRFLVQRIQNLGIQSMKEGSSRSHRQANLLQSALRENEPGFDFTEEEIVKFKIWRHGIVPYYIDTLSFDKVLRDRIRSFLALASVTGLKFLELQSPPQDLKARWVFFINRRGQLSCDDLSINNFTNEEAQKVLLGYDCLTDTKNLAEMVLAVAGVPPQHNSPDRDKYIKVYMDNIIPEKRNFYTKLRNSDWLFHDIEYDISSAGHYDFHRNTFNGSATIRPLVSVAVKSNGKVNGFSITDVLKIRILYNYISKKTLINSKQSACKKIFKPGTKLTYNRAYNIKELKIRPKPNLYHVETEKKKDDATVHHIGDYIKINRFKHRVTKKNSKYVTLRKPFVKKDLKDLSDYFSDYQKIRTTNKLKEKSAENDPVKSKKSKKPKKSKTF